LRVTTRYLYFCAGIPSTPVWAERFVSLGHTDGFRSFVLVADVGDDLIGFARFSQGPHADPHEHSADMGIVLTDAWQRRGLGGQMLKQLAKEAMARGVTTLTAEVLWANRRMLRLAHRIFPNVHITYAWGSCVLTIDLDAWRASHAQRMSFAEANTK
jgi:RimJ/RimL family protein N-acetyltransferase